MQSLTSTQLEHLKNGGYVGVAIAVTPTIGDAYTIDDDDILAGSFSLDRSQWSTSQAVEIGNADAAELSFVLDNADGRWNSVLIEGATMVLSFDINGEALAGGYFIADRPVKGGMTISVSALDYMSKFNKLYDGGLTYPATLLQILTDCATDCGVTLDASLSSFTNSSYSVTAEPTETGLTYHQLVAWVAQLAGGNAWVDWDGQLRISWYGENSTEFIVDASMEFPEVDHGETEVQITGVQYVIEDTTYTSGTAGYVFRFSDNPLLQTGYQAVLDTISAKVCVQKFLPFSNLPTVCLPHIWPGDIVIADAVSFVPADDGAEITAGAAGADIAKVTNGAGISGADLYAKTYFKAGVLIGRHRITTRSDMVGVGETATVIGYQNGNGLTDTMRNTVKAMAQTKVESLDAGWIRTGRVQSTDGNTYFDLETPEFVQTATIGGVVLQIKMDNTNGFRLVADGNTVGQFTVINGKARLLTTTLASPDNPTDYIMLDDDPVTSGQEAMRFYGKNGSNWYEHLRIRRGLTNTVIARTPATSTSSAMLILGTATGNGYGDGGSGQVNIIGQNGSYTASLYASNPDGTSYCELKVTSTAIQMLKNGTVVQTW